MANTVVTDPMHISLAFVLEVSALTDTICLNFSLYLHTHTIEVLAPATSSGFGDF